MPPPSSNAQPQLPDRRWQELCGHIRYTDDVSFKLLAFVPLISIAGLAVPLMKTEPKFGLLVVLLSFFAAAITLSLWVWERRNIQNCNWLRDRAASLERQIFGAAVPGHFFAFPRAPDGHGKAEAERLVYGLTIAAWLLLPLVVFASDTAATACKVSWVGAAAYVVPAVALGFCVWRSLRVKINLEPEHPNEQEGRGMIKAVDIEAELARLPFLHGRGKETTKAEAKAAFATLAPFRDGSIFAGSFSGESPWERHQSGDELVHILAGAATLTIMAADGPRSFEMTAGMMIVVPQGHWYRFHAPDRVTVLTATPQPTEHTFAKDPPGEA